MRRDEISCESLFFKDSRIVLKTSERHLLRLSRIVDFPVNIVSCKLRNVTITYKSRNRALD